MGGADRYRRERPEGDLMNPDEIQFEADLAADRATGEPALVVDVECFEGPLDLLLALARQQKVDLAKISILALADQYLAFIEEARKLRLELAADYLVMAAWLAYLKSRLLLPEANAPEGQSAEDMAIALALRLKRLEVIRDVAQRLFGRPPLERGVIGRGSINFCCPMSSSHRSRRRCWHRASPPRWKWCARASWRYTSRGRLRRSTCASANRLNKRRPMAAWRRRRRRTRVRGGQQCRS